MLTQPMLPRGGKDMGASTFKNYHGSSEVAGSLRSQDRISLHLLPLSSAKNFAISPE